MKPFLDYLKDMKLDIDEDYIHALNKDVNRIVHHVKFKFNRPRPAQVSDIKPIPSDGGYSPSYPSGHSVQVTVLAGVLSKIYPELSQDFQKIAVQIGENRIKAGLHYPSDHKAGQALGMDILEDVPSVDSEQHLKKADSLTERERDPKFVETEVSEDDSDAVMEQNEFMERLRATTAKHVGDKKDDSDEKAGLMAAGAEFGHEIRLSDEFESIYKEDEDFKEVIDSLRKKI